MGCKVSRESLVQLHSSFLFLRDLRPLFPRLFTLSAFFFLFLFFAPLIAHVSPFFIVCSCEFYRLFDFSRRPADWKKSKKNFFAEKNENINVEVMRKKKCWYKREMQCADNVDDENNNIINIDRCWRTAYSATGKHPWVRWKAPPRGGHWLERAIIMRVMRGISWWPLTHRPIIINQNRGHNGIERWRRAAELARTLELGELAHRWREFRFWEERVDIFREFNYFREK